MEARNLKFSTYSGIYKLAAFFVETMINANKWVNSTTIAVFMVCVAPISNSTIVKFINFPLGASVSTSCKIYVIPINFYFHLSLNL